ncbi:MAG: M3 family oligoendopeptidase [Halobacteriovoraceae bacterium]|jgi:oligoendopeptidase F|nr:M3 family oligoendopeptidase [Halobacteriovoraceae bacterium]MBT5093048.1 M3 family oligoendopeptidase [Halobacteriovoraceae bacterium]
MNDCTTWDNSQIFTSLNDPKIENTLKLAREKSVALTADANLVAECLTDLRAKEIEAIPAVQNILKECQSIGIELMTVSTYCNCLVSVDAKNEAAKQLLATVSKIFTELGKLSTPVDLFITGASETAITLLKKDSEILDMSFEIDHNRQLRDFMLNNSEEKLTKGLAEDGLHAWGKLYFTLAGNLECNVDGETLGFANASSLLRQGDRPKREAAWKGINAAWEVHSETVASILNSLNGWRLEENQFRSSIKEFHYLDKSCHQSHITRKTLNSLMETTFENRQVGQRAHGAMAKALGIKTLAPWDILSPAPKRGTAGKSYSFSEAIDTIAEAYSGLAPEMGEFVHMMHKKNWIDAKETEARSPGAYCTGFAKQREPRVFMTFDGSMGNVITLAHELGHAYHSWVMRDMPISKTHYAMTTAETASIFGETLVRDFLFEKCQNDDQKFEIAWQDAESAGAMLCNIPARFEFEKSMIEKRKERPLSPSELKEQMGQAWKLWYGDSLSQYDEMYWASKLHFSISQLGFYNYPYLFGYLFSLGIYAQRENFGDDFNQLYIKILRDTGSMNAVDLIKKHLSKSIEEKEFWQGSLDIVEKSVARFERLV